MSQKNPSMHCAYIDTFNIEKGTCVTIKLKCLQSGLVQELRVKRMQDDIVHGWFREYSGMDFELRADLGGKTVALVGMDYSWHHHPRSLLRYVIDETAHMMALSRTRGQYQLTRNVAPLKSFLASERLDRQTI